jgi:AraC-like DNA-binding protein
MDSAPVDLLLRTAIFAHAMSTAVMVATRDVAPRRRSAAAPLLAFAIGGIGAFAVSSAPMAVRWFGLAGLLFDAWCIATPAALWILAQTLFREDFRARPLHWSIAGVLTGGTLAADLGRFRLGVLGDDPMLAQVLLLAGRGAALLLVLGAAYTALDEWRVDLVESRRRARVIFVAIIMAVFATLTASDFVFGPAGASEEWLALGHSVLVAITFALLQAVARGSVDELVSEAAPRAELAVFASENAGAKVIRAPAPRSRAITAALATRVAAEMEAQALWRREGLGIGELASVLDTQEYLLRRAINQHLGYRNFNDFLHEYRLREAARRLGAPADDVLPVLTIALDCGYGSIGPFNRAFKARFGVTPTQYRNQRHDERGQAASPEASASRPVA